MEIFPNLYNYPHPADNRRLPENARNIPAKTTLLGLDVLLTRHPPQILLTISRSLQKLLLKIAA